MPIHFFRCFIKDPLELCFEFGGEEGTLGAVVFSSI